MVPHLRAIEQVKNGVDMLVLQDSIGVEVAFTTVDSLQQVTSAFQSREFKSRDGAFPSGERDLLLLLPCLVAGMAARTPP
jgi:hypothetical protein